MANQDQYAGLRRHSRESNELTRSSLKGAMIEIAKYKNYKDISVTELCKRAGVSRMAFYRNYQVVNDIIYEIAYDLNNRIISSYGSPFRKNLSSDWYRAVFVDIRDNRDTLAIMFQENFQYQWMKIVNSLAIHNPSFSNEKKYQRMMWSGGFENIVSYWLNNGLKETPEELAEYCVSYLPNITVE